MYLFNANDEGFLLLSASKLEEPILAYSTEAPLELSDMPRDLAIWIDLGVTKISQLNRKEFYYNVGVYDAWRSLGFAEPARDWVIEGPGGNPIPLPTFTREDVGCPYIDPSTKAGPLLGTIMWGQGEGYNKYQDVATGCTGMPDGKYWAGCTLVAFGQIMKYYGDFGNLPFGNNDVAKRVMNLNSTEPDNVSILLKSLYIFTSGTNRDYNGTGASIKKTAGALVMPIGGYPFKYNSAQYHDTHQAHIVWQNIVQQHRPVVLAGYGVDEEKYQSKMININYKKGGQDLVFGVKLGAGHAWVCDGYKEEVQKVKVTNNSTGAVSYQIENKREFWHMNWGWHTAGETSAYGNGWYRDGLFNPVYVNSSSTLIDYDDIEGYDLDDDGVNDGAYHLGYYYNRSMVVNIIP